MSADPIPDSQCYFSISDIYTNFNKTHTGNTSLKKTMDNVPRSIKKTKSPLAPKWQTSLALFGVMENAVCQKSLWVWLKSSDSPQRRESPELI